MTASETSYRDFFKPLIEKLRQKGFERVAKRGTYNKHYQTVTSDIKDPDGKNVGYGVSIDEDVNGDRKASVYLWIESDESKVTDYARRIYNKLRQQQSQIESEIDSQLVWDDGQLFGFPNVSLYRVGSIYHPPEILEEIREWMQEYLVKFRDVFNPRLKEILEEEA